MVICGITTISTTSLYGGRDEVSTGLKHNGKLAISAAGNTRRKSSPPEHRNRKRPTYILGARPRCPALAARRSRSRKRSKVMSADTKMSYQSCAAQPTGGAQWRGCVPGEPWKAVEILAMVLGFIVFWPIGLAVLVWKKWQPKSGYPGDIISFGREKWGNRARWGINRWGFAAT